MIVRGEQIRALREERGYTLQELARRANLSFSYLSEIERGSKKPSLKTIEKLAAVLNVAKSQLVENDLNDAGLTLGNKIRMLRNEKALSLQELSTTSEISLSYLSEIERGTIYPSLNTLKKISESLDVSASVLMSYEGSLGNKLKALREKQGYTQAKLAELAGVTAGLIGQIEQSKVQPSLKTLEKLSGVLGISACYFIMEPGAVEQIINMMTPELREMLLDPKVQSVLGLIANLNEKELQFVLNFIQLLKRSDLN
ncbi:transcriptional regulator, XRE family [Desulfofarcimen acetoxidans DSM 771]|jgi:transcriptional regulator with XRE-family HTH domain|uniref:Transcriptional regulator, XRE family n=1 Tax=Desulfofarcimen acetoxidans (strain ATCC 49208 / DSM 771 / KCTC 5769 / VKM B-1644 / 5575) TaxID=485916 RepID=C8VZU5_DESAS|nr:helix-turn-helix transcriptional regulator [Desulfofarcimen acetoxidans]ACV63073.1 transcriptional regulator, XRE family [Desulfofarcimen acetoxidans DSM 771]